MDSETIIKDLSLLDKDKLKKRLSKEELIDVIYLMHDKIVALEAKEFEYSKFIKKVFDCKIDNKNKNYGVILTEHQLRLIANCVEDMHRFFGGQMDMFNTVSMLDNWRELRYKLDELKPLVTPYLPHNACYGWNGGSCPNANQRKFLAETYCIYREIIHRLTVINHKSEDEDWNVYLGSTLTCKEGGELPIIEKL